MLRLQELLEKRNRKIKKRISTKVPRRVKEERLSDKRITAQRKKMRGAPDE